MSDTLNTPMSTGEQYLGAIVGQTGVTAPDHPVSRMEEYLDYLLKNGTAREAEIRAIVEALKGGMTYKGSVATVADLPTAATANKGWVYTIVANGHEYVSDGTQWIDISADLSNKEDKSNKVTSFQATPDDTHYPSEKLVKDSLDAKGTYSKPDGGIPKTDLASAVQTSLDKADSAIQSHQSLAAYRTSAAQDVIDATKSSVSVSASGTATDEVQYITINGVEKKLAGGGGAPDEYLKKAEVSGNTLTLIDEDGNEIEFTPTGLVSDLDLSIVSGQLCVSYITT